MTYDDALWLAQLAPIAVIGFLAVGAGPRGEHWKVHWAIAVAFAISFVADMVMRELAEVRVPNWGVVVFYPIAQIAVLTYGMLSRWRFALQGSVFSLSITAAAALVTAFGSLPIAPEMRPLAVASVIALWLVYIRSDLSWLLLGALVMAFGVTFPAVVTMHRIAPLGLDLWFYKVPFTCGALLAAFAIWRDYSQPAVEEPQEEAPPFPLKAVSL